jgi:hypothetical protein
VLGVYVLLPNNQQFWCWIGNGSKYNVERLAGEYVWMWIALAVSKAPTPIKSQSQALGLGKNQQVSGLPSFPGSSDRF